MANSVNSFEELYDIVLSKETKVVSFDCFDTLLLWPYEPYVLVELAAEKACWTVPRYKRMRNYKGKWWGNIDLTQEQIIGSNEQSSKFRNDEMNFDLKVLRPRKSIKILFEKLLELGKEVIITTDMYLPQEFIETLLIKNGFKGYKKVYLSKNGLSKSNSKLFKKIIDDYKTECKPENIVHIGDNYESDYKNPQLLGITSILLENPRTLFRSSYYGQNYVPTSNGDRLIIGLIANYIFDNPFTPTTSLSFKDFSYMVGAFLTTFTIWMNRDALRRNIEKIFLIMSDGYLVKEMINCLAHVIPTIPVEELYCSRLSRSPDILLDEGITGDIKQLKHYLSLEMFSKDKRDIVDHIINQSIKANKISNEDILILNNALNIDYLINESNELKKYLDYSLKNIQRFALFDGSYNATAYKFFKKYTKYLPECEYQLVGSAQTGPIYNYIQSKTQRIGAKILDLDPCIKTSERKVDHVHIIDKQQELAFHGYERPHLPATLIQYQALDFETTLIDIFDKDLEFIACDAYTFWNPIVKIWESASECDRYIVDAFEQNSLSDFDQKFAISILSENSYKLKLAEYYLSTLYDADIVASLEQASISAAKGEYVGMKKFVDIVLKNNMSKYYGLAIMYIKSLQNIDVSYYARMARLYRYGKGLPKNITEAINNYRISANSGIIWAKNELFDLLVETSETNDPQELFELIRPGCELGNEGSIARFNKLNALFPSKNFMI